MSKESYVFRYTHHAEYQLFNRNITKQSAEYTVLSPDEIHVDSQDPSVSIAVRETSEGTFMKVWYRMIDGEPLVTTVLVITLRREHPQTKGGK
jgi:hypothetical protein